VFLLKLNYVAGDATWCVQIVHTQSAASAAQWCHWLWRISWKSSKSVQRAFFGWFQSDRS